MADNFAPSLLKFFQNTVSNYLKIQSPRILEVGSGKYSIFEATDLNKQFIETIDLKNIENPKQTSGIKYLKGNISDRGILKTNFYDLIFDSHCLHCLHTIEEQELALKNIYNGLVADGIFASEIMVQPSHKKVIFPKRIVGESIEIENLILKTGFKIIYFVIVPKMSFYLEEGNGELVCDILRIIAKK